MVESIPDSTVAARRAPGAEIPSAQARGHSISDIHTYFVGLCNTLRTYVHTDVRYVHTDVRVPKFLFEVRGRSCHVMLCHDMPLS